MELSNCIDTKIFDRSGKEFLKHYLETNEISGTIVTSFSELLLDAIFVKSLVFEIKSTNQCVVLVLLAEDRVEAALAGEALAEYGGLGRRDVGLASRSTAIESSGYSLGWSALKYTTQLRFYLTYQIFPLYTFSKLPLY